MRFNDLTDDERWLIPKLRDLNQNQREVIYMLVRHMSQRPASTSNIIPFDLQAITRRIGRTKPPQQ